MPMYGCGWVSFKLDRGVLKMHFVHLKSLPLPKHGGAHL